LTLSLQPAAKDEHHLYAPMGNVVSLTFSVDRAMQSVA
jgi:hypothetical protein